LKNLQIEEQPGQTAAGLTSASQLVNITSSASFEHSNTSSDIPELVLVTPKLPQPSETLFSGGVFRRALRRSMRHESKILDVLAKY